MCVDGWLLDSGCTDHMSFDKEDFKTLELSGRSGVVVGAGGDGLEIRGSGEVVLELEGGKSLTLKSLLYVPTLQQRLVSVSCLQSDAISCLFFGNSLYNCCEIRNGNELIATIPKQGKLWVLNGKQEQANLHEHRAAPAISLQELHHKLGHASTKKLLAS